MRRLAMLMVLLAGCGTDVRQRSAAHWAERLQSNELSTRLEAVDMLGRLSPDDKDLVPALVAALADTSEEVGQKAGAALRSLGDTAVTPLVDALKSDQTVVRQRAVVILCSMTSLPDAAQKAVLKTLQDPSVTVRTRAAEAFEKSSAITSAAVPALCAALTDDSAIVRYHVAAALGRIGPLAKDAVPDLQKALQDEDPDVGRAANDALRRIGSAAAPN